MQRKTIYFQIQTYRRIIKRSWYIFPAIIFPEMGRLIHLHCMICVRVVGELIVVQLYNDINIVAVVPLWSIYLQNFTLPSHALVFECVIKS